MNLPGFGPEQHEALHRAKVLVIGAGGLGCPIMQTLAATGVGHISLIDDDVVDLTNIHRQILFGASDVGRKKIEVAAERLQELQPGIRVDTIEGRMDASNATDLLDGVDVLIDGSDTFSTKFLAADAAEITGTPLVWGSVLRYRGDVALWWTGPGAPETGAGMRDLYPEQPDADSVPDCATAGVLGVTTSVVGGLMSTEVVKFLTGVGDSTPGKLHIYDALTASIRQFTVTRDPGRPLVTKVAPDYGEVCTVPEGRVHSSISLSAVRRSRSMCANRTRKPLKTCRCPGTCCPRPTSNYTRTWPQSLSTISRSTPKSLSTARPACGPNGSWTRSSHWQTSATSG